MTCHKLKFALVQEMFASETIAWVQKYERTEIYKKYFPTVVKETVRLRREVVRLKYWKNFVQKSLLTPNIRRIIHDRLNCEIDSVIASKNETCFLKFSVFVGSSGISSPSTRALQLLLT